MMTIQNDCQRLYWISVLNSKYSRLCPKMQGKNTGYFGSQNLKIQKDTAACTWFSLKWVTHKGFSLYFSLKWRYTAYKTMCFTSIVGFCAAFPLFKWQRSKNSVMSCTQHKQSHCSVCWFWPSNLPLLSKDPRQAGKCQYSTNNILAMTKTIAQITLKSD